MKKKQTKSEIQDSVKLIDLVLGVVVIVFWIFWHVGYAGAVAMFLAFFLAGGGSGPGGPPSQESVDALIQGLKIGVVISALAGFPAGFTLFLPRGERKQMFRLFLGTLALGALIQIGSFLYFYAGIPTLAPTLAGVAEPIFYLVAATIFFLVPATIFFLIAATISVFKYGRTGQKNFSGRFHINESKLEAASLQLAANDGKIHDAGGGWYACAKADLHLYVAEN